MPSNVLRLTGLALAAGIAAMAYAGPATAVPDGYAAMVRVISGAIVIAGSLCLAGAIGRTFLRSGGVASFKAAYVAAMALSGPGLAEAWSAFQPVNTGNALLAYCIVSTISAALWVRFYGRAAGSY